MKKFSNRKYLIVIITLFAVISFLTSILYINQSNKVMLNTYIDSINSDCSAYFRMLNNLEDSLNSTTYKLLRSGNSIFSYATDSGFDNDDEISDILKNTAQKNNISDIYVYYDKSKKLVSAYSSDSLYNVENELSNILDSFSQSSPWYFSKNNRLFYISHDFSGFFVIYSLTPSFLNEKIEQFTDKTLDDFFVYSRDIYLFDASALKNNVFQQEALSQFKFKGLANKSYYKDNGYLYICNANYRYTIIAKRPISAFTSYKLKAMQGFILVLIIMFCGFLTILYFTYMISKKRILSYNNILKSNKNSEHSQLSSIIKCAYTNTPVSPEILSSSTEELSQYNSFMCISAKPDFRKHEVYSFSAADMLTILSATIVKTISESYKCCSVICSNDTIMTVIYLNKPISRIRIYDLILQIQASFKSKTNATSSYLFGNIFNNGAELYPSLISMNQFSEFRFLYGYNSIVYQDQISQVSEIKYPAEIVHKITHSLVHSNPGSCLSAMDQFFKLIIMLNSPMTAKEWIASMLFSVIKDTQFLYNHSTDSGFNFLKQALDCTTIDECILLIQNIFPEVELIRTPPKIQPNELFKQQVASIISDEYANPDMNISYMADRLKLTSAYFGQKFVKEFDTPFNIYLSQYRINCSMKLLTNTSDKISDIAIQCGFSSAAYFTKAFKEHTNMTPSQYRSKNQT